MKTNMYCKLRTSFVHDDCDCCGGVCLVVHVAGCAVGIGVCGGGVKVFGVVV